MKKNTAKKLMLLVQLLYICFATQSVAMADIFDWFNTTELDGSLHSLGAASGHHDGPTDYLMLGYRLNFPRQGYIASYYASLFGTYSSTIEQEYGELFVKKSIPLTQQLAVEGALGVVFIGNVELYQTSGGSFYGLEQRGVHLAPTFQGGLSYHLFTVNYFWRDIYLNVGYHNRYGVVVGIRADLFRGNEVPIL